MFLLVLIRPLGMLCRSGCYGLRLGSCGRNFFLGRCLFVRRLFGGGPRGGRVVLCLFCGFLLLLRLSCIGRVLRRYGLGLLFLGLVWMC